MGRTIQVSGMSCGGCEEAVEEALERVEGVAGARADRETGDATVEGDAPVEALLQAVEDAGYGASA